MKFLTEYRDREKTQKILEEIAATATRTWRYVADRRTDWLETV